MTPRTIKANTDSILSLYLEDYSMPARRFVKRQSRRFRRRDAVRFVSEGLQNYVEGDISNDDMRFYGPPKTDKPLPVPLPITPLFVGEIKKQNYTGSKFYTNLGHFESLWGSCRCGCNDSLPMSYWLNEFNEEVA